MARYALAIDCNRCVGCMACNGACKMTNNVPIGSFWNKVLRIGPNEPGEGEVPSHDFYFLPVQCQHCEEPECVKVCPTGASHKLPDGTVQIDKGKCIGCQFCAMSCPYGVRYLNEAEGVVEKCTLCEQKTAQGELPMCVDTCVGLARWFGDMESGDYAQFSGPLGKKMGEVVDEFSEEDVHTLPNVGNNPSFRYILRDMTWQGEE